MMVTKTNRLVGRYPDIANMAKEELLDELKSSRIELELAEATAGLAQAMYIAALQAFDTEMAKKKWEIATKEAGNVVDIANRIAAINAALYASYTTTRQ